MLHNVLTSKLATIISYLIQKHTTVLHHSVAILPYCFDSQNLAKTKSDTIYATRSAEVIMNAFIRSFHNLLKMQITSTRVVISRLKTTDL